MELFCFNVIHMLHSTIGMEATCDPSPLTKGNCTSKKGNNVDSMSLKPSIRRNSVEAEVLVVEHTYSKCREKWSVKETDILLKEYLKEQFGYELFWEGLAKELQRQGFDRITC